MERGGGGKRRRRDSNPRIRALQAPALPLGHVAVLAAIPRDCACFPQAGDGIRTHDLLLGKETFYH